MDWNNKNVLVTGAAGFIGSHLAERMVTLGARTRGFVHYNSNSNWGWLDRSPLKDEIEIFSGDIRERDGLDRAMQDIDVVFHLAALISIPYSYDSPTSYFRTNIEGTLNVVQAAADVSAERIIVTSTSEVYGSALRVPIDEKHPLQAQSPYSASKIGADKLVESFHNSFDYPIATLRPFNTYGPRQSARAIIPSIITQALTSQTIKLGNLWPTRDLNYVSDTVDGFVRTAETPAAIGQAINIGAGKEISIGDLAKLIVEVVGSDSEIVSDSVRERPESSEVDRLCAGNAKAKEILGWGPSHSLREGIAETVEWISNNLDQYKPSTYLV
jgi:NAD dependent epimerase/dehydratase